MINYQYNPVTGEFINEELRSEASLPSFKTKNGTYRESNPTIGHESSSYSWMIGFIVVAIHMIVTGLISVVSGNGATAAQRPGFSVPEIKIDTEWKLDNDYQKMMKNAVGFKTLEYEIPEFQLPDISSLPHE